MAELSVTELPSVLLTLGVPQSIGFEACVGGALAVSVQYFWRWSGHDSMHLGVVQHYIFPC